MIWRVGRQYRGGSTSRDASGASGPATLGCFGWIVEDAQTICRLRVCTAAGAILLSKVTLVSHELPYLGRGGTPDLRSSNWVRKSCELVIRFPP